MNTIYVDTVIEWQDSTYIITGEYEFNSVGGFDPGSRDEPASEPEIEWIKFSCAVITEKTLCSFIDAYHYTDIREDFWPAPLIAEWKRIDFRPHEEAMEHLYDQRNELDG